MDQANSSILCVLDDVLVTRRADAADADALDEEPIVSLERIPGRVRTVALHVPGTNTYLADSVWTHNDSSGPALTSQSQAQSLSESAISSVSSSGSSSGSSSASKSSGSSFSGSSSGSGSSGLQSPDTQISDQASPGGFSL